jgi:SAM-dependent methyltransferase
VIATDASPAMVELARECAGGAEEVRVLVLPDDPLPPADAVVSVGHVVSYLDDEAALQRALRAVAGAVRPGGLFALDICDLEWGAFRREAPNFGKVEDDWAIVTRFEVPSPDRFVRHITTFLRNDDGSWRRDDERHDNVLVDVAAIPAQLAAEGVEVTVASSFGAETLPAGLRVLVGRRREPT